MKLNDPDNLMYLGVGCIVATFYWMHWVAGMFVTGVLLIALAFLWHFNNDVRGKK